MVRHIFPGLHFALDRAVDKYVVQPLRSRQWSAKSAPFDHFTRDGLVFRLDPAQYVDRHIFEHGIYERRFLELLRGRFEPGSIALDIGANIGNHAIFLADTFACIHAFEPNPEIVRRLKDNIDRNDLSARVVIHPFGLGKSTETLEFAENNDGNFGASGFLKPGETANEKHRILLLKIVAADAFVTSLTLPRLDFIKIDVEGWEPPLFEGLRETIARYRPIIAFEFHGQSAAPQDFDRIRAALKGYVLTEACHARSEGSLIEKLRWNLARRGRPELRQVDVPQTRTYENLLAFPDEARLRSFERAPGL